MRRVQNLLIFFTFLLTVALWSQTKNSIRHSESKDEYIDVVNNKVDQWEDIIKKVRNKTFEDIEFVKKTTHEEAEAIAAQLEKKVKIVKTNLEKLKQATVKDWKRWQVPIQTELNSMKDKIREKHEGE